MSTPRAVSLLVSGTVQGVSYRAGCADRARELGLTGWVTNRDDGHVEVWAEGEPDAVESHVDWCHDGPPAAQVTDVEVRDLAPEGASSFDIRR